MHEDRFILLAISWNKVCFERRFVNNMKIPEKTEPKRFWPQKKESCIIISITWSKSVPMYLWLPWNWYWMWMCIGLENRGRHFPFWNELPAICVKLPNISDFKIPTVCILLSKMINHQGGNILNNNDGDHKESHATINGYLKQE